MIHPIAEIPLEDFFDSPEPIIARVQAGERLNVRYEGELVMQMQPLGDAFSTPTDKPPGAR